MGDDRLAADMLGGRGVVALGAADQHTDMRHDLPGLVFVAGDRAWPRKEALGCVSAGVGSSKLHVGAGNAIDLGLVAAHLGFVSTKLMILARERGETYGGGDGGGGGGRGGGGLLLQVSQVLGRCALIAALFGILTGEKTVLWWWRWERFVFVLH